MVLKRLQRAWLQHLLYRSRIPYSVWHKTVLSSPELSLLNHRDRHRLRKLASLFLHEKSITGVAGHSVDITARVYIAAMACLLILNLDLDYFKDWDEILVYPETFLVEREEYDDIGVVHHCRRALAGESWQRGPVIISWSDVCTDSPSSNVILHEIAHKLDMLNGVANGMPPLHADMVRQQWTACLSRAYDRLRLQLNNHQYSVLDAYAASDPAEFFAVLTETFFQQPLLLHRQYRCAYEQLRLYYRQDPLTRYPGKPI